MTTRRLFPLILIIAVAVLVVLFCPFIGLQFISPLEIFKPGLNHEIFFNLRLPRTLLGFLAGAALSLGGVAFQSVFRNPLASPYTLGVSSGASLGAAIHVRLALPLMALGLPMLPLSAFAGALLTIVFVYAICSYRSAPPPATLLLAGVAVSLSFSSLILFIQYLSSVTDAFRLMRWLMGALETVGYSAVFSTFLFAGPGIAVVFLLRSEMNQLAAGEELALSRGVDVRWARGCLLLSVSAMIGGVVSLCGPIGFVGLMGPHISRFFVGSDHRVLVPSAAIFGGAFLVICDTVARTALAPTELPVGIITALLGGPFFLWLLTRPKEGRTL
jgi:iron complex transport system permease protein